VKGIDREWLRSLPKAEVHVHLEGSIPWDLLDRVAHRAGVEAPRPTEKVPDLAELLRLLDRSCPLLTEPSDLEELAYAASERSHAAGASWTDFIINPTHWPEWTQRIPDLVTALDTGFASAEKDGLGGFGLCISLKRNQSTAEALAIVETLGRLNHPRVVALSIDGNEAEVGRTGQRFAPAFERAADLGLHRCVHAGESSGPEGVRDAIDLLGAERIDHGVRAVEDPRLVTVLARSRVPLDICPTSNVTLGVVGPGLAAHPIEKLRSAGVLVSINTDDPVLFGTDLLTEYERGIDTFGWGRREVVDMARTSINSCFAPNSHRASLLGDLAAFELDGSGASDALS
jgi:adenosine deaminase